VSRCHRDPDARADVERLAVERECLLERGEDLLPDACRARLVRAGKQDGELVAAKTRDGVRGAQGRSQARAHLAQQVVADVVPEAVVHGLEVGQVHHEDRDGLTGTRLTQELLLQTFDEQRAVR
jgi:hypothetical protein